MIYIENIISSEEEDDILTAINNETISVEFFDELFRKLKLDSIDRIVIEKFDINDGLSPRLYDETFGETVMILSVGAPTIIEFANERYYVNQCALLILDGDYRYKWKHSIEKNNFLKIDKTVKNAPEHLIGRTVFKGIRYSISF